MILKYLQQIGYLEILINRHEFQGRREKRKKEKKAALAKIYQKNQTHVVRRERGHHTKSKDMTRVNFHRQMILYRPLKRDRTLLRAPACKTRT